MTRNVILTTESRRRREETITFRVYLTGVAIIPVANLGGDACWMKFIEPSRSSRIVTCSAGKAHMEISLAHTL